MDRNTKMGLGAAVAAAAGIWALTAAMAPRHATTLNSVAAPGPERAAPKDTAKGPSLSFRDVRMPLDAGPPSTDEKAAPANAFADQRPLVNAGFRDARPITTPSFRDERTVVSPQQEERPGVPAFRDNRAILDAPSASGSGRQLAAIPVPVANAPGDRSGCVAPDVVGEALEGGRMRLTATAECRANQAVRISYGGAELVRTFDAAGRLDFVLDCFAGAGSTVDLRLPDGARVQLPVTAKDLDKVSKVAVIWRAPINLDLHVFEYAARFGQPGHIWAKASSTLEDAQARSKTDRRGHGFLSSTDSEQSVGDKVEVYTLLHDETQAAGAIGLALDYETRGDLPSGATCGAGDLAEVDFQVVILPKGGKAARQSGVLTRAECGVRLAPESRFNQATLPGLRIRR